MNKTPKHGWTCFHCGETFHCPSAAADHFGATPQERPLCIVSRTYIVELEKQLREYRDDDTPLHRKLAEVEGQQAEAVRRSEEEGYAKGLQDGKKLGYESKSDCQKNTTARK